MTLLEFFALDEVEHPLFGLKGRRFKGGTPASYRALEELKRRGRMTQAEFMGIYMGARAERFPEVKQSAFLNNFGRYVRNARWVLHVQRMRDMIADEKANIPAFDKMRTPPILLPKEKLAEIEDQLERQDLMRSIRVVRPPEVDWRQRMTPGFVKPGTGSRGKPPRKPDMRKANEVAPRFGNMLFWVGPGTQERSDFDSKAHWERFQSYKPVDPSVGGTSDEWMLGDNPDMER